jgi:outer membrane protein assembly factor BamB
MNHEGTKGTKAGGRSSGRCCSFLRAFVVILSSLSSSSSIAADPPPDLWTRKAGVDWPGFLGPSGDNKSPETGLRAPWPEKGPPVLWTRRLGTSYGGPSVARGRLFTFERHGDQARLSCLKAESGEELWRHEHRMEYEDHYGYNNGPRCTPVVDFDPADPHGGRVYSFGVEGQIHCLRFADGKPLWQLDTAKQFHVVQNFFGVGSTPVIEGGLLIVQVGGSPPESPPIHSGEVRGAGSGVVAFEKLSGQVVWQLSDELASYASPTLATIGGRRWGFVFARGGLVAFEPQSGKLDFVYPWRARILESVNAANPVVVGDEVFISECYGPGSSLLKVRPGAHEVVWKDPPTRQKAMQTHWNTSIHHQGFLYGSSGRHSEEAELRCIEWRTGKRRWSQPGLSRSTLLWVDGHLVCLTETGELMLLKANPERFELISRFEPRDSRGQPLLKEPAWAPPVLAHGLLFVRGRDQLVCLELIPASK